MIILTLKTDSDQAQVTAFKDTKILADKTWVAHRQLADTLHNAILEVLAEANTSLNNLEGIVVFEGPGSFTGLRIGISVANTLSYSLGIPIIAGQGINWAEQGIEQLLDGQNNQSVTPEYGALPHITQPKR